MYFYWEGVLLTTFFLTVKLDMLPQDIAPLGEGEAKSVSPIEEGDEDDDVVIPQKSSSSLSNKSSVSKVCFF